MIDELYSDFDPQITIRVKEGKTFNKKRLPVSSILEIDGVESISQAIEAEVILKHQEKWVNAHLIGVENSFLSMSKMSNHMVDGEPLLDANGLSSAVIGASLLDKLDGFIPSNGNLENLICYVPKRNSSIKIGKNPFKTGFIKVAGRFNYNKEVNESEIIVPIEQAGELLGYKDQLSALYINCQDKNTVEKVKQILLSKYGDGFDVKTNREKNALIYQTSKSEKLIVLFILIFIFVLAAFNLVSSLIMLFVEKIGDINTLKSFGAGKDFIFKIFFFEGLLISFKGILIGLFLGVTISALQLQFGWLEMPNSYGEPFPIGLKTTDITLIFFLVSVLSILFSYFPVRYLVRKNF